ncbi:MAG TPA: N-carbamoylputrescine amidase [Bacillota bacterium]|nr:N-carbamoylputrescine amidase [Bacillota bacterium]
MRKVTVAAIQMACSPQSEANLRRAEELVRQVHAQGAQIALLPELFETPYFCQKEVSAHFKYATELGENKAVQHFRPIARELKLVLPISFFERKNNAHYNSVAVIDANGDILGVYRKTHLPTGPGYQEKFYFNPGDTGFKVWPTRYGKIGVGICWDQWFPETARCLTLQGAELLLYPTAIGSEPEEPGVDSKNHWQLCMQGHSAANLTPVLAANRIGTETVAGSSITFYGSSFITNHLGEKITEADRVSEKVLLAEFDLDDIAESRRLWGVFRDRRPEMYQTLVTSDGEIKR